MMSAWLTALSGLLAGTSHVISGPDHLAAVLPLAAGQPKRAAVLGTLWGLGHGIGVIVFAALGRVVRESIDLNRFANAAELLVGLMLLLLGAWTWRRSRVVVVHSHGHAHPTSAQHSHVHVHVADRSVGSPEHPAATSHRAHNHSAFGFGVLHGSAGAGHLLGVLPSLALQQQEAVIYLAAYFVAAIVAMGACALTMGHFARDPQRMPMLLRITGAGSILVGLYWAGSSLAQIL